MERESGKTYIAIDLKSFYASVECMERGLDPMLTNLVVADKSRTEKTICLAVSPSLKAYGVPGRPRLFEVVQKVGEVNAGRRSRAPGRTLTGSSCIDPQVRADPSLALDYLVAPPRMALYMKRSTEIYHIYLNYIAPEDIHVYSIDEVLMDATPYLAARGCTARELAMTIIRDVLRTTGITATAGIGTNLYLCKIAMDIEAKHTAPDEDGVRIAELDELSYRRKLWTHRPLTDFWRVGRGYAKKLESRGLFTMGDIARCSLRDEERLYQLFGVNAELLIDHAWGWEPCTMADLKAYKPESNSMGAGQVLQSPYPADKARIVTREMAEALALELVRKGLVTDRVELVVGYDREGLASAGDYAGPVDTDRYGREVPKAAHGVKRLDVPTASSRKLVEAVLEIFDRVVDARLPVRRINLAAGRILPETESEVEPAARQLDLFTDYDREAEERQREAEARGREKRMQRAMVQIQEKYGKNAILKGTNLQEGATAIQRNEQIGGHKA